MDDEDMLEVARWVVASTPFDRLYFYGPDLPVHVSFGPENKRQIVHMMRGRNGRLVPRVITAGDFCGVARLRRHGRAGRNEGKITTDNHQAVICVER